jgi:hypothetical protein
MSELKTKENDASVAAFIDTVPEENKRQDSYQLLDMYKRVTGEEPKMWGSSIIGFGKYHYKSGRSSQEGDWPLAAFSPRKQNLTLYFMSGFDSFLADHLAKLGRHKTSKACLYIKRLSDVDVAVLEETVRKGFIEAKQKLT